MSQKLSASTEFCDAFASGIGSYNADCACGRTHFAGSDGTWSDNEEIDELREKAKRNPGKYIDTGDCPSSFVRLGSADYINGCPCGMVAKYEDWVWSMRKPIIEFIKAQTAKDLQTAQEQAALMTGVSIHG